MIKLQPLCAAVSIFAYLTTVVGQTPGPPPRTFDCVWPRMQSLFVFGDSYSTTGFNATDGEQPSSNDPLGNPKYPGYTSSNGPNRVDYLTVKYNESLVLTYNLAYGGATVDSTLAKPYLPTVLSFQQQVQQEFLSFYTGADSQVHWDANSTLFAFWFGINDIGNTYASSPPEDYAAVYSRILDRYAEQVQAILGVGAQNFLFLTVPPVQRSPLTQAQAVGASALEAQAISIFNNGIVNMAEELRQNSTTAKVAVFDTYSLFEAVLDDPDTFQITKQYINTTNYCTAYENGTSSMSSFDPSCTAPVNEYFWLNSLHPTYPMHDLLASLIAASL